jgi:hypothetical protein
MPDGVVREPNDRELQALCHLSHKVSEEVRLERHGPLTFPKPSVSACLSKGECGEMGTSSEHACFCKDTDTSDSINLHLDIRITIWVTEISQMRSPGGVFGISLDDDGIFIECLSKRKGGLGLLPGIEIVGLFASKPVRKRSPDIFVGIMLLAPLAM